MLKFIVRTAFLAQVAADVPTTCRSHSGSGSDKVNLLVGVPCQECEKYTGMPCELVQGGSSIGICVDDFDHNGVRTFKCKAKNVSWKSEDHADVAQITDISAADIRPSGTTLTLPANTARSFAVFLACGLAKYSPHIVNSILSAGGRIVLFVDNKSCKKNQLKREFLVHDRIEIIDAFGPGSIWMRDYGNFFLLEKGGINGDQWTRIWNADHQYRDRVGAADLFPIRFAHYIGEDTLMNTLRYVRIEGGNVLSNGAGKCIMSKKVLCQNARIRYRKDGYPCNDWSTVPRNAAPKLEANGWGPMDFNISQLGSMFDELEENHTKQELVATFIVDVLRQQLGCEPVLLEGVPGDALDHVDMYYFFLNENTIFMGTYNETTWEMTHDTNGIKVTPHPGIDLGGTYDSEGKWKFNKRISPHEEERQKFRTYMESTWRNQRALNKAGFTVVTTAMPHRVFHNASHVFFTHMNGIAVSNDAGDRTVLMPTYSFPSSSKAQREADIILRATKTIFEEYGWLVRVTDARGLLMYGGAIHCVTKTIPYVKECAHETKIHDYYQCLENKIPDATKAMLREREFEADMKMRSKITQRPWTCNQNPNLLCEPSSGNKSIVFPSSPTGSGNKSIVFPSSPTGSGNKSIVFPSSPTGSGNKSIVFPSSPTDSQKNLDFELLVSGGPEHAEVFTSCSFAKADSFSCPSKKKISLGKDASWITQDPDELNTFYAAIEKSGGGVQKWTRALKDPEWMMTDGNTDGCQGCHPVHTVVVDGLVVVSWLRWKAVGAVTIHNKNKLEDKYTITLGTGGSHGAFVHNGYIYFAMFQSQKVCWLSVDFLKEQTIDVSFEDIPDSSQGCVDTTGKAWPRHIAFSDDNKAYVACEHGGVGNNLYVYDVQSSSGKLINKKSYCLSPHGAEKGCGTKIPPEAEDIGHLGEIRVYKDYVYVSNRVQDSSEKGTPTNAIYVLKRDAIDTEAEKLPLLNGTEGIYAPKYVRSMDVSPNGHFLVAAGQNDGRIVIWELDSSSGKIANVTGTQLGSRNGKAFFVGFVTKTEAGDRATGGNPTKGTVCYSVGQCTGESNKVKCSRGICVEEQGSVSNNFII